MGELNGVYDGGINGMDDDDRVHEWEFGLPNVDDITPLNHGLVPPELLSAFNIKPEPYRNSGDVTRASEDTISTIRGQSPSSNLRTFDDNQEIIADEEIDGVEGDAEDKGSDSKKPRRNVSPEDADSAAAEKTLKRQRLVWTPQLHKRFVDVVAHLSIKNAVPKTIMQLMNVEGLTRENVASHLQKYRLYLKRMQGASFDTPSNSSAPEHENGNKNGNRNGNGSIMMPYGAPQMMPVPVPMMGMGHGHMGTGMGSYNGFESNHHQYNGMMQTGNKYGSVVSYHHHHHYPPHVAPGDK